MAKPPAPKKAPKESTKEVTAEERTAENEVVAEQVPAAPTEGPPAVVPVIDAAEIADNRNMYTVESNLETTLAQPQDRQMRYRRNPSCPKCAAHPSVCRMRRGGWASFRCRSCNHHWEVTR